MKSRFLRLFRRREILCSQETIDPESQPHFVQRKRPEKKKTTTKKKEKKTFILLRRLHRSESLSSSPSGPRPSLRPISSSPSSRLGRLLTQAVVAGDSTKVTQILKSVEDTEGEEEGEEEEGRGQMGAQVMDGLLYIACGNKDPSTVRLLLDHGASPDGMGEERDCAPIHMAVRANCLAIASLLLGRGACLNIGTKFEKRSPLHVACSLGSTQMVGFLLENRVRVDQRDIYGSTALHMAARMGHVTVARALLDHGAGVDTYNSDGWTALHLAAEGGKTALVELLLVERRADVDRQNRFGRTALHWASAGGHLDTALALVRHGANAALADAHGKTPVDYAATDRLREALRGRTASPSSSPPPPPPSKGGKGGPGIGQLVEIDSRSKWELYSSGHISRQTLDEEEEKETRERKQKDFIYSSPLKKQQQQQRRRRMRTRQMRHYRSCEDFLSTDDGRRSPGVPWGSLRGAESADAMALDGRWGPPGSSHSLEYLATGEGVWEMRKGGVGSPLSTRERGRTRAESVIDSDSSSSIEYLTDTLYWSLSAVRTLEGASDDPLLTAQVDADDGFTPAPDPFQVFFHLFVCHVARSFDGWKRLIQGLCLADDRESDALRTVTRSATAPDSHRHPISRSSPDMTGHQNDQRRLVVSLSVCAVVFVHRILKEEEEEEREEEEKREGGGKARRMLRLMDDVFEDHSFRIVVRNFVRVLSSVDDTDDVIALALDEFCSMVVNHWSAGGCSQSFAAGLSAHLLPEPEPSNPVTHAGKVDHRSVDDVISRWKWKTATDGTSSVLEKTTDLLVALIDLGREDIAARYFGRYHRFICDSGAI